MNAPFEPPKAELSQPVGAATLSYAARRPTGPLGTYVASIWVARGQLTPQPIAPTGCTVAAVVLSDPIRLWPLDAPEQLFRAERGFVIGAHDRPVGQRTEGELYCVGVTATPVGCQMALGVAPGPIKRRVVGLSGTKLSAPELVEELRDLDDSDLILDRVQEVLGSGISTPDAGVRRCQSVINALTEDPSRSIDALARDLSVSHGYLDEEFKTVVGLGPRAVARVIRLRALLARADQIGIDSWEESATAVGWFEQPLLIRDFRRHTGLTPREFVRARRNIGAG